MDRWAGKIAIVTGASSGIGAATAKALVEHGVKVVGLARRVDKLEDLAAKLGKDKFYPIKCDLRKEEDIANAFKWVEKKLGCACILVNNAGVVETEPIIASPTESYYKVLDTNVISPAICAREFAQSLNKCDRPGHIVNINSIAGHYAAALHIPMGMYGPSKYAVTALGTELRHEFIMKKQKIKVTSISPGAVKTEMFMSVSNADSSAAISLLTDKDIADAVVYTLGTPPGVEIHELTIMPQGEFIGIPASVAENVVKAHAK